MTFEVTVQVFDFLHYAKLLKTARAEIEADNEQQALEMAFNRFTEDYPGTGLKLAARQL